MTSITYAGPSSQWYDLTGGPTPTPTPTPIPYVSFAAAPPPASSNPDFWSPPSGPMLGQFHWDGAHYVLVQVNDHGKIRPPTADELSATNPAGATPPGDIPKGIGSDYVEIYNGEGPIWRQVGPDEFKQVGYRKAGQPDVYFTKDQYAAVDNFNTNKGITYAPGGDIVKPTAEDPTHPDFWVPPDPAAKTAGKFRWDPSSNSYVLVSQKKGDGVETELSAADFAKFNQTAGRLGSLPPKQVDYVDSDITGDKPIWRLTKDGSVVQVGIQTADGKNQYFDYGTYTQVNAYNKANNLTATVPPPDGFTAGPADTGAAPKDATLPAPTKSDPGNPDKVVYLADGKTGILYRWDPTAGRYVGMGTVVKNSDGTTPKNTTDGSVTFTAFSDADYKTNNNGLVAGKIPPAPGPKDIPDWQDDNGAVWRWDKTQKPPKAVQIGWTDSTKGPGTDGKYQHEITDYATFIALQKYNDTHKDVNGNPLTPTKPVLQAPTGSFPTSSWGHPESTDPDHPNILHTAYGDPNGKVYIWRWDSSVNPPRYCAAGELSTHWISETLGTNKYSDDKYHTINTGANGVRLTPDGSPPADITPIPSAPDPTHPDDWYYDAGQCCIVITRWNPATSKMEKVGWKTLTGSMHYFSEEEYRDRNGYPPRSRTGDITPPAP